MNRIIKFRAWDTDKKQFVNCDRHDIGVMQNYYGGLGNRFVYQEFTGLKDKLKKEIFENDIVKITNFYNGNQYIGVVKMIDYSWCVDIEKVRYQPNISSADIGQINVIGNIMEHPELLKLTK